MCLLHAYANGAHEERIGEILAEEAPGIAVSLSSPRRAGVPRVRPREHHRHQRGHPADRAGVPRLDRGPAPRARRRRRAARDAVRRRRAHVRGRRRAAGLHRRIRARGRRHRDEPPRAHAGPRRTRSRSTWAAPPPRSASCAAASRRSPREYHVGAIAQPGLRLGARRRLPDPDAGHRARRDRRRRRLDRLGRHRRRAARRADERRRRAGPGRLRPGRHRADGHRREPRARAPGRRLVPRAASCTSTSTRPRGRSSTRARSRSGVDVVTAAYGIVEIANAAMASALRLMSVQRGLDPRTFALVGFGGAGPVHANRLASEMGIAHDDPAAQPRHVLRARPAAQRPAPRLLPDVPAADRDGRHGRDARDLRAPRGRRARDAPARAGARRRRRDRVRRRDAVRRPELHAPDPAAERDADRRRHGRRRAGLPRRPRTRLRLQRSRRADRRSSTCGSPRSGRIPPWEPRRVPSSGPRPEPKQTRAGLLRGGRRLRRDADLRPGGARARDRP